MARHSSNPVTIITSWCGSGRTGHCDRNQSKYGYGSASNDRSVKKSIESKSVMVLPSPLRPMSRPPVVGPYGTTVIQDSGNGPSTSTTWGGGCTDHPDSGQ